MEFNAPPLIYSDKLLNLKVTFKPTRQLDPKRGSVDSTHRDSGIFFRQDPRVRLLVPLIYSGGLNPIVDDLVGSGLGML
jgi:hypothetical protein